MVNRHLVSSTFARLQQFNRAQLPTLIRANNGYVSSRNWSTLPQTKGRLNSAQLFTRNLINPVQSAVTCRFLSSQPNPGSSQNLENDKDDDPKRQSENETDNSSDFPLLMDFVPRGMPNFWYSMKNLFIVNVILRNQIDRNFDYKNFIQGARQALIVVSSHLANNRLDSLTGLVDQDALTEIKRNYAKLNVAQRKEYELMPSDIVISFAHHVRIQTLTEEFTGARKHVVYFFIVFDCIKNLDEILREKAKERANAREIFHEFAERKYICNYEFKREYIEGLKDAQPSDWIITKLLHIKEKDLISRRFQKLI